MPMPEKPFSGQTKFDKDWFVNLWEAVQTCMLSGDGKTTFVQRCWGTGSTVKAAPQTTGNKGGAAGASYAGYFTVIDSGEGVVKIVNGADPDALICGSFTAGSSNVSCDSEEVAVSGAGVVYLRIYYDEEYLYEFGFASTLPSADDEIYIALASISADGTPAQVWTGGAINLNTGAYVV